MIRRNKISLILASLLTLSPIIAGVVLWDRLPEKIPTHWGVSGEADGYASKPFAVLVLPLIMLAFMWLCVFFTTLDKKNKDQNEKVLGSVVWIVPLLSCVVSAASYVGALGYKFSSARIILSACALMFIVIGNYMPKCKQNRTIGIKIKWTLESEENWLRTHRFAGIVWFVSGIFMIFCLLLPENAAFIVSLPILLAAVGAPIIYSYLLHKKGI